MVFYLDYHVLKLFAFFLPIFCRRDSSQHSIVIDFLMGLSALHSWSIMVMVSLFLIVPSQS